MIYATVCNYHKDGLVIHTDGDLCPLCESEAEVRVLEDQIKVLEEYILHLENIACKD